MKTAALGLLCTVALTAAAGVLVAPAGAVTPAASTATHTSSWRPATPARQGRTPAPRPVSTKRLVIRAVTKDVTAASIPASAFTVERVRVSRVNPTWAAAKVVPKDPSALDPADVLVRRARAGTWTVADLGTAEVGCGIAPAKVLRGLDLRC